MTTSEPTKMSLMDNGPILVTGEFSLTMADGTVIPLEPGSTVALCRCGASSNKPFCDGSHKQVSFDSSNPPKAE